MKQRSRGRRHKGPMGSMSKQMKMKDRMSMRRMMEMEEDDMLPSMSMKYGMYDDDDDDDMMMMRGGKSRMKNMMKSKRSTGPSMSASSTETKVRYPQGLQCRHLVPKLR